MSVGLLVSAPVVGFGFVYDDHWTVENDRALELPLAPLLRALFAGQGVARGIPDATRPAMVTSLWLERRLFGLSPAGYHFDSLVLYGVCILAAGLAVFAITRRSVAAVVGAAVFAVSPVHAEVVASVNYREDLIAGVAVFVAIAFLFAPRRRPIFLDDAVLVAALAAVGLLGKESASVLLPVVAAVALVRVAPSLRTSWIAARKTPLVALGSVLAGWAIWRAWLRLSGRDDVPVSLAPRGLGERLLRTGRYSVRSVVDAVVPVNWAPDRAPEGTPSAAWLVLLAALVVAVVLGARRRSTRSLAAGLAIALVAPLATSPLVSPINERTDRYLFVATLGGAVIWGDLAARAFRRAPTLRFVQIAVAGVVFSALALLTVETRRALLPWQSDEALWRTAILRAPGSSRAYTGLSRVLRTSGRLDEADAAVEHAIALDPTFLRARVTRVYNLLARGEVERARVEIADIERRGGRRQLGMRHARTCAALAPEAARQCVDSNRVTGERPGTRNESRNEP